MREREGDQLTDEERERYEQELERQERQEESKEGLNLESESARTTADFREQTEKQLKDSMETAGQALLGAFSAGNCMELALICKELAGLQEEETTSPELQAMREAAARQTIGIESEQREND